MIRSGRSVDSSPGSERLLDEVAMADHARGLDDVAQLHLPPLAARVGLAQGGHERAGLGPQPLAGVGQRPQLRLEPPARLTALLVEREQLRVDPAELLLDRPDQLLDRRPALLELAVGLGLGGLQLRPRHLGQLRHARLQRVRAQRLERLAQLTLGVLQGRQAFGRPLALMRQVGARLNELTVELDGAVGLDHESAQPRSQRHQHEAGADQDADDEEEDLHGPTSVARRPDGSQECLHERSADPPATVDPRSRPGRVLPGFGAPDRGRARRQRLGGEPVRRLGRGRARGRARRGSGGRGVLPAGPQARTGRPRSRSARSPSRDSEASRSASAQPAADRARAQTSTGSSLPARRSRPRCTAAMNFDRLTSSVLRISSA